MIEPTAQGIRRQPQQARAREKRDAVLDAGQRLIAERGYGTITITDIAREAKVGLPTVYQLFANKLAILVALCERKSDRINAYNAARIGAAIPQGWRAVVRAGIESFYDLNREDPTLDPLFIASQDIPTLRALDREQNASRVEQASFLYASVTGLPLDDAFREFTLVATITTASIVRHSLMYDDARARRFIEVHVINTITRLEAMGAA